MPIAHLLDGLNGLPPAEVRARLVEAKAAVAALLATDLSPEIRAGLTEGMAAIDAGLAQAAVTALRDSVEILRRAEAKRTVAAALKHRPPINPDAQPIFRTPPVRIPDATPAALAPIAGPAVAEPAMAAAVVAPPRLLRPLPPRPAAAAPVPAPVARSGGLAGLKAANPAAEEPEAEVVREEPAPRPVPQARAPIQANGKSIGTPAELRKKFGAKAEPYIHDDGTTDYRVPAWDPVDDTIPF